VTTFVLLSLLLALGVWLWQAGLQAWETARAAAARACQRSDVQLLDDTVALQRLWWRRDQNGRLRSERVYHFEFTDTGTDRRLGRVVLLGQRVEVVQMEGGELIVP
jgi:membrane protein implicated in regulation of membrane protease activity